MTGALVTGASSGIGAGIVEVLTAAGIEVDALARRADRLADLAARTGCRTHSADVTDRAALARVVGPLTPDIVVLNAGRGGGFDGVAATDPDEIAATVATNVTATLQLLHLVLPGMIERGSGHIVSIGSVAELYPSISAVYGGTKAAIGMIAQNLRMELAGSGVRVTNIRPGRVRSEFYDIAINDPARAVAARETGIRELQPREIGEAVLYAVTAPRHVNVSTIELQPLEQSYGGMHVAPVPSISRTGPKGGTP